MRANASIRRGHDRSQTRAQRLDSEGVGLIA